MNDKRNEQRKRWAENHPEVQATRSMKRRKTGHDYSSRCIYMITLVVRDRKPLLGELCGNDATHDNCWVRASEFGRLVRKEWENIPQHYPQVKVLAFQLMPDHVHGVIFVTERLPRHLGHVINGFKKGCNDAWKRLITNCEANARNTVTLTTHAPTQTTHAPTPITHAPTSATLAPTSATLAPTSATLAPTSVTLAPTLTTPSADSNIWEWGYHDRILSHKKQLDTMLKYLRDNPRRLWVKRNNPHFFAAINGIKIGGITVTALGNQFLLDYPVKIQVQCSRSMTHEEIEEKCYALLSQASYSDAVLVSPCISLGEKEIMKRAFEAGFPQIIILENGISPMQKPSGRQFDACADGQLLLLSPWEHHNEYRPITREQCLQLNAIARKICE